jgi:hypothetical protein
VQLEQNYLIKLDSSKTVLVALAPLVQKTNEGGKAEMVSLLRCKKDSKESKTDFWVRDCDLRDLFALDSLTEITQRRLDFLGEG